MKRILLISSNDASGESLSLLRIILWHLKSSLENSSLVNAFVCFNNSVIFFSSLMILASGIFTTSSSFFGIFPFTTLKILVSFKLVVTKKSAPAQDA
jgi:hypothetical protein